MQCDNIWYGIVCDSVAVNILLYSGFFILTDLETNLRNAHISHFHEHLN